MKAHGLPSRDRPHDKYFKAVFSIRELALELLEFALPANLLEVIDKESLGLASDSYVDEHLNETFSDLVYHARLQTEEPVKISFLFEHKSYPPSQPVQFQLLRYILNSWESDLRQNKSPAPVISTVVYHGRKPWKKETLVEHFARFPKAIYPYIPDFEFHFVSLRNISDAVLFCMNLGLLRNVFLALKHARDEQYLRQHFAQIVIFAEPISQNEIVRFLFNATLLYLKSVSSIRQNEFKVMITEQLSPELKKEALTVFEQIMQEGEERGIAKGIEQGKKEIIKGILHKHPDWSDNQIAELLEVSEQLVKEVRTAMNS